MGLERDSPPALLIGRNFITYAVFSLRKGGNGNDTYPKGIQGGLLSAPYWPDGMDLPQNSYQLLNVAYQCLVISYQFSVISFRPEKAVASKFSLLVLIRR